MENRPELDKCTLVLATSNILKGLQNVKCKYDDNLLLYSRMYGQVNKTTF